MAQIRPQRMLFVLPENQVYVNGQWAELEEPAQEARMKGWSSRRDGFRLGGILNEQPEPDRGSLQVFQDPPNVRFHLNWGEGRIQIQGSL